MSGFGAMPHGAGPVGAGAGAGGGNRPVIKNFIPERGEEIATNEPVQFDIVDPDSGSFEILALGVSYATGDGEKFDLVHDGDHGFRGLYTNSVRSSVPGGFRYLVNRDGGWPSTPTFEFFVVDNEELEAEIDDS